MAPTSAKPTVTGAPVLGCAKLELDGDEPIAMYFSEFLSTCDCPEETKVFGLHYTKGTNVIPYGCFCYDNTYVVKKSTATDNACISIGGMKVGVSTFDNSTGNHNTQYIYKF
jgi:hypothetical protein